MSPPADIHAMRAIGAAVSDVAVHTNWPVRIHAAAAALHALTGRRAEIVRVRAVAYNRGAVLRLGGALLPSAPSELEHFREQVGRAMLALGYDTMHAVLTLDGQFLDVLLPSDHAAGVIVHPITGTIPSMQARQWTNAAPRFGVVVAYERHEDDYAAPLSALNERLARNAAAAIAAQARWFMDSGSTRPVA